MALRLRFSSATFDPVCTSIGICKGLFSILRVIVGYWLSASRAACDTVDKGSDDRNGSVDGVVFDLVCLA